VFRLVCSVMIGVDGDVLLIFVIRLLCGRVCIVIFFFFRCVVISLVVCDFC